MKKLVPTLLLLALSFCVYGQQRINRNVAGFTLGRYYSTNRAEDIIWKKFSCMPRIYRESSSTSIMTVGSIPFAGEKWDCFNVIQDSSGKISEILFGKDFKEKDEILSFCLRLAEMIVTKYGAPVKHSEEQSALEWVWADSRNTTLHLQAVSEDGVTVWLSYTDESLKGKIQSDTLNEL